MKKIESSFILCLIIIVFACCGKGDATQSDKVLFGQEPEVKENVRIHRFEVALFAPSKESTREHLLSIEKDFKPMFAASLSDNRYMQVVESFVEDREMKRAYREVKQEYPDLKFLEKELSEAISRMRQIRKDSVKTNIYTLMVGPMEYSYAYENRILVYPEFSAISIDLYSMDRLSEHPYYKSMPKYLQSSLTKDNIVPDYVYTYLREITFRDVPLQSMNPEASFLDCIIDEGKYIYATQAVLKDCKLNLILRYTEKELEWVEKNESNIWGYIIQNQLLYNKDRTKYMHLTAQGPGTKNIAGSPSRIGYYIGYKIVQNYMRENSVSLDSLFKISDSELILRESKYKPENH